MKLKQIKLAGFKSFVDPTVLDLRSDLVAVVGPNGCGKSNVIDAVRWVMGESSAKTLRGESITDVIFNGSNSRKPIGQASIELLFDNSDGAIGGEYAAYAEISVRREVTRDAVSNYYLNGTKCRRRDIVDVFLGTGLGSRSYSIIEQGMISRVIESKPEELRTFVEEAAGISVYKKRRHDTELRMRHTVENLARLEDLRDEQIKLLERLQRQAESAQKYQSFTTEKDKLEAQLLAMRWRSYDSSLQQLTEQISSLSISLDEKQAAKTKITAELEENRVKHTDQVDVHENIQSKYYELGSMIARTEQGIQYHKDRNSELNQNIEQLKQSIAEITQQRSVDSDELFACEEKLAEIRPEHEEAHEKFEQAEEIYLAARADLDAANSAWEDYQLQAQKPQQEAEVQRARIEQLDKQASDLQNRIEKLGQEKRNIDLVAMDRTVSELATELKSLEQTNNSCKDEIKEIQEAISTQRNVLLEKQDAQNIVRNKQQELTGRRASLQALQQAAMGKDNAIAKKWLQDNNLDENQRLAEKITVENGFDIAVETVLSDYLEAICVDGTIDAMQNAINDIVDSNITLLEDSNNGSTIASDHESLASKVQGPQSILSMLDNIMITENLSDALSLRQSIIDKQSIVTKDGIWLGKHWIRVRKDTNNQNGVIAREQELQQLNQEIDSLLEQANLLDEGIVDANNNLHEYEVKLVDKQQEEATVAASLREVGNKHSALNQKYEHMRARLQRIEIEINEQAQTLEENGQEATIARNTLEIAIESMADFNSQKEKISTDREQCIERERNAKHLSKETQEMWHNLEVDLQTISTKYEGLQHTISRVDTQLSDLHQRHQQLQQSLQDDIEPEQKLQAELEQLLASRLEVEGELQIARSELETYNNTIQNCEKQRDEIDKLSVDIKDALDKCRLDNQSLLVRKETIDEQLQECEIDLQKVLQSLDTDANEEEWTKKIETITRKISNLGAVNLAAAEELATETQRQEYLESQYVDLKEALTTLENAIKKIDKETKVKFQETYDKINSNFSTLFPKLFGGGKAYLDIVGDDLLNAGVSVMAMPPGKKNSSIHLLSGGEKALTAVALVFSIFQINPAPFCMLDEVDAPLDESNVVRFSNLIKDMSSSVQFIIISHNKTTMEIANQLIGVTMKEPGVSRLVSVDINEAVELATV